MEENNNINEYRCNICFQVPFINSFIKDNKLNVKIKCLHDHQNNEEIKEFSEFYKANLKKSLDNVKCFNCNKIYDIKNNKNDFYYCINCYNFICNNCKNNHDNNNNNHKIIEAYRMDSTCGEHDNSFIGFCKEHKINFCMHCDDHMDENNFNKIKRLTDNEINIIINNDKNNEIFIKKLENSYETLKNFFSNILMDIENYINIEKNKFLLMRDLLEFYIKKNNEKNINYQLIENLKINDYKIDENITNNILDNINLIKKYCETIQNNIYKDNTNKDIDKIKNEEENKIKEIENLIRTEEEKKREDLETKIKSEEEKRIKLEKQLIENNNKENNINNENVNYWKIQCVNIFFYLEFLWKISINNIYNLTVKLCLKLESKLFY
jgi:hypothetical protein